MEGTEVRPRLMSLSRLAYRIDRHPSTIRSMLADPNTRMPPVIRVGNRIYFEASDVEAWISEKKAG